MEPGSYLARQGKKVLNILIVFGFLVVIFGGFFVKRNYDIERKKVSISIREHSFLAEVVSDENGRRRGLGGKDSLCEDCGMFFVFEKPGEYSFWMKDMLFSIDILWILDGKIVFIRKNIPATSKEIFTPSAAADRVLELNAGVVDELGIKIGDSILLR